MSSHTDKIRDNTRITFPSTAGSGIPYAILKIAPFVYGPTPLVFQFFFTSLGTIPPYTSFTSFTAACKFRALE